MAGSAIGLGNFLRFPSQAALNGGGAFMIPYFLSLFLLGLPLMWIEWAIGRYGGFFGHGTAPLIFNRLWKNRATKYFGAIGVFGPLAIFIYYTYIESWLLGYMLFSLNGKLISLGGKENLLSFLSEFQNVNFGNLFSFSHAYIFFLLTFCANFFILYRGVKGGIENLCKIALPLLFVFAIIIAIRVWTLGAPDKTHPDWNIVNGLGFLWNPDFSALRDAKVWLAASGQVFFTLSVGIGVIITYASYLSKGDDIVLSGLTATSLNELAEVILGGSIVIPLAFAFFGPLGVKEAAGSGTFNIGFASMPLIFSRMPAGIWFSFFWFSLLFLAGITSSVSLIEPAISFLGDELSISRKKAVVIIGVVTFILCQFPIFLLSRGVLGEIDFWAGTFCLVLFATSEVILFVWIFGIERAWEEIHHGAELHVPKIYKFIIKYITPLFLFFILGFWFFQQAIPTLLLKGVSPKDAPFIIGTRLGLLALFLIIAILVRIVYRRRMTKI